MKAVTKEIIASHLEERLGLPSLICEELVSQIFNSAIELVAQGHGLKIKNFGSFVIHQKASRPGMNWKTSAPMLINSHKVVKFSPSRNLKMMLK